MENANKLQIVYPDEENDAPHPHCPHGPTLLFQTSNQLADKQTSAYYACAAHRDKRLCSFQLPVQQLTPQKLARRYELDSHINSYKKQRQKVPSNYCIYIFMLN